MPVSSPRDVSFQRPASVTPWPATVCVVTGAMWLALTLQSVLGVRDWSANVISPPTWHWVVQSFGGSIVDLPDGTQTADVGLFRLFGLVLSLSCVAWLAGAWVWRLRSRELAWSGCLARWGWYGWRWLWLAGLWEVLRIATFVVAWESGTEFLIATPQFWLAISLAGWLTEFVTRLNNLAREPSTPVEPQSADSRFDRWKASLASFPRSVWIGIALYTLVFTVMNWQLWFSLRLPHGDSAMYEEHLWNLLHGKGFRSYLDQGLFFGEHIQVIHLLLIPLYVIWPSHLLLEFCQSIVLALGALPVYSIARRHTGSPRAATCLACAYLLYFPIHFLDISIDLKTFRPTALAVPILLATIDQFERRHFCAMWIGVLLTLSAQEDFSIILACWGLWMLAFPRANFSEANPEASPSTPPKTVRIHGLALMLFNAAYLFVVLRYVIPWFRSGVEIHYTSYFSRFGRSIPEIVSNVVFHPLETLSIVVNVNFFVYALALLAPIGFLPLRSWHRLLVSVPLFVTLCLNEVAANPRHHFHAPVIPFLFWAAAAGLGTFVRRHAERPERIRWWSNWAWTSGVATALFFGLSPLGIAFWDAGSLWHWRSLYVPDERAEQFPKVYEQIPLDSRVASTDFVHPRFTHHERSYDYSQYKRRVSDYELTVPDDTDYIVIDTQHPYSEIKSAEQIREYRDHPEVWELLPDETDGYFIVLKRREVERASK